MSSLVYMGGGDDTRCCTHTRVSAGAQHACAHRPTSKYASDWSYSFSFCNITAAWNTTCAAARTLGVSACAASPRQRAPRTAPHLRQPLVRRELAHDPPEHLHSPPTRTHTRECVSARTRVPPPATTHLRRALDCAESDIHSRSLEPHVRVLGVLRGPNRLLVRTPGVLQVQLVARRLVHQEVHAAQRAPEPAPRARLGGSKRTRTGDRTRAHAL